ncbi:RHS repeat-associated core domain-containing protein [Streptomyces sp. NBC_00057]|uniref:RHS repeat-associated core domain-containing protein n=1 Tax=Streptomyces sp. NBC_00057 TaxID=2975634 RepID=UPI00324EE14E
MLYLGETELTTTAGKITRATRSYVHEGAPTVVRSTVDGATTGHKLTVLLADPLGTATTAVEQSATQPVTRRSYKPYGENRGTQPTSWPDKRSYLGVGIDDAGTGLIHLGAREYDQSTGRFLSADPVKDFADPLQMNGYAYSHNSPVSRSDPSGLYDPDRAEANRLKAEKKKQAQSWRKMWTNRHDTAVYLRAVFLQVWDFLHNAGRGRVTTERTSNYIKGGSYKNPGKKPGYADLICWTDKTVYL